MKSGTILCVSLNSRNFIFKNVTTVCIIVWNVQFVWSEVEKSHDMSFFAQIPWVTLIPHHVTALVTLTTCVTVSQQVITHWAFQLFYTNGKHKCNFARKLDWHINCKIRNPIKSLRSVYRSEHFQVAVYLYPVKIVVVFILIDKMAKRHLHHWHILCFYINTSKS